MSTRSPSSESKESVGEKTSVGLATAACSVCSSANGVVEGGRFALFERIEEVEASRLEATDFRILVGRGQG